MNPDLKKAKLSYLKVKGHAPIYDNGSSLARELSDEKIESLLLNDLEFDSYINKGLAEIHWETKKLNHFELITKLTRTSHKEKVLSIIQRVSKNWVQEKIIKIINEIDANIPAHCAKYKLSEVRKRFIIKLVTLRFERLKGILK